MKPSIRFGFQQKFNLIKKTKKLNLVATKPLTDKVKTKNLEKFPVIPYPSSCNVKLTSQI